MALINSFSDEYDGLYTQQDIEELDSSYEEEKEYINLMDAYTTVFTNITYYPEDQLHNLLDLLNRTLQKG